MADQKDEKMMHDSITQEEFNQLLMDWAQGLAKSQPPDATSTILVRDLEKITPQSEAIRELIAKAKRYEYDDFKSRIATPKLQLVMDLKAIGLNELARRAMRGDYD